MVPPIAQTIKLLKKPFNISLLNVPLPLAIGRSSLQILTSHGAHTAPTLKSWAYGRNATPGNVKRIV